MSYVPPIKAIESNAIIDRAAVAAGREPLAIRRIYFVLGSEPDGETLRAFIEEVAPAVRARRAAEGIG